MTAVGNPNIRAYFERNGQGYEVMATPQQITRAIQGSHPDLCPRYKCYHVIDKPAFTLEHYISDDVTPKRFYTIKFKGDGTQHTFANPGRIGKLVSVAWDKWRKAGCDTAIVGLS